MAIWLAIYPATHTQSEVLQKMAGLRSVANHAEKNSDRTTVAESMPNKGTGTRKKVTFNLDIDLYEALREQAFKERTDMTVLINQYIRQGINS